MALIAKTVVDNKFWIINDGTEKIGTIQSSHLGIVFTKKDTTKERFASIKIFSDKYNVIFDTEPVKKKEIVIEQELYGFPCNTTPYNTTYNVEKKLPLYTKKENSISYYCAGWYLIKFSYGWSKAMNPKFITLQRNEFLGPFKTKLEMLDQMKRLNNG